MVNGSKSTPTRRTPPGNTSQRSSGTEAKAKAKTTKEKEKEGLAIPSITVAALSAGLRVATKAKENARCMAKAKEKEKASGGVAVTWPKMGTGGKKIWTLERGTGMIDMKKVMVVLRSPGV